MTRGRPQPGDRVVIGYPAPWTTDPTDRGILLRVDTHDWCDVLLDSGELVERGYHIREVVRESEHSAAEHRLARWKGDGAAH